MAPNIAVVVLDSLRYDSFRESYNWIPGTRYTSAYSTSHWTVPAHASLFTGFYPSETGVNGDSPNFDARQEHLPELLQANGYSTRCYTANPNLIVWGQCETGFTEVVSPANLSPNGSDRVNWSEFIQQTDATGYQRLLEGIRWCFSGNHSTIKALKQGFSRWWNGGGETEGIEAVTERVKSTDFGSEEFLLLNIMEPHTPYEDPETGEEYNVVIGEALSGEVENEDELRKAYSNVNRQLSEDYKDLYQILSEDFDYIVTLSDHGELLGEYGMWNHGYGLYPELVHVPLVLSGPEFDRDEVGQPVNLLDIHKTIAVIAGIDVDSRGRDLTAESIPPKSLLTEYHGLLPWHQDQLARYGVDEDEFDRLNQTARGVITKDGEYAYETPSGEVKSPDDISPQNARKAISEIVDTLREPQSSNRKGEIDEEVKEHLRELGYA